jgi:hypothetical protein
MGSVSYGTRNAGGRNPAAAFRKVRVAPIVLKNSKIVAFQKSAFP